MADLERPDLDELEWSAEHRSESLSRVFDHAVGFTNAAEGWYAAKRQAKRRGGSMLRIGAIGLGAAAAVLPILAQISTGSNEPSIAPAWAAVALVGAATLVALDKYFGFSSAWMRFMAAELRITHLRHEFEYSWQLARAAAAEPPSDEQVRLLLERARHLVLAVDDLIAGETAAWIGEFQTSLDRAEQKLSHADR